MKRVILSLTVVVAFAFVTKGQKCTIYEKGQQLEYSYKSYFPAIAWDQKWAKYKPKDKQIEVDKFNKAIEEKTQSPQYAGGYKVTINDIDTTFGERILLTSEMGAYKSESMMACKSDTMYILRTIGVKWSVTNKDTTGWAVNGVQKIPNVLHIGDVLQPYQGITVTFPVTENLVEKKRVVSGFKIKTTTENGLNFDSNDGNKLKSGQWKVTTSEATFKNIDVNVKKTTKVSSLIINYFNAHVIGQETITVNGKPYSAYVIESETWKKTSIDIKYEEENTIWQGEQKKKMKMESKINKMAGKTLNSMNLQNEQGYNVSYITEWFVPRFGVVKLVTHDANGFLTALSELK